MLPLALFWVSCWRPINWVQLQKHVQQWPLSRGAQTLPMVPLWVTCWRPHKTSTARGEASNTRTTKRPVSNDPWERSGAAMMLIMLRCSRKIAHTNRILSNDPWRSRGAPWRRNGDGNDVDDAGSSPAQSMQLSTAAAQVHRVKCMLLLHDSGGIVTKVCSARKRARIQAAPTPFPGGAQT